MKIHEYPMPKVGSAYYNNINGYQYHMVGFSDTLIRFVYGPRRNITYWKWETFFYYRQKGLLEEVPK